MYNILRGDYMTELEEAIFSEESKTDETSETEECFDPEEVIQEGMEETARLKQEIEAENELLDRRFNEYNAHENPKPMPEKKAYIGIYSCAASLILMGIALYFSISSPLGAMNALKVAPLMLVFLGLEIVGRLVVNKKKRLVLSVKNILLTLFLIGISSILTIISAVNSTSENERAYVTERIRNIARNSIGSKVLNKNIKSIEVTADLYEENLMSYISPSELGIGDRLNVSLYFADNDMTIRQFASSCRDIMDDLKELGYPYGEVKFITDDGINRYTLDLDWLFQSEYSAEKLSGYVNYFGDNILDSDIPDIDDIEDNEEN